MPHKQSSILWPANQRSEDQDLNQGNLNKNKQLGMPYGTATAKLRKQLLFKYVTLSGDNTCFKCNIDIDKIEEFTIEHKSPWLHENTDLFWDLNNIAFSHRACNKPDRPYLNKSGKERRITYPENMVWCNFEKKFLPVENFSKNRSHWSGFHSLCKEHQHYNRRKVLK